MKGRLFVTILGLLIFQALGAALMSIAVGHSIVELSFAAVAIASAIAFLFFKERSTLQIAVGVFALGTLNVLYLALTAITPWTVLLLCMAAAGFLLTIDELGAKRLSSSRTKKTLPSTLSHGFAAQAPPFPEKDALVEKYVVIEDSLGEEKTPTLERKKKSVKRS